MKNKIGYSYTQLNDFYNLTLDEFMEKIKDHIDEETEKAKKQGYEIAEHSLTLDGDGDSYGSSAYIQISMQRWETDKEKEQREKRDAKELADKAKRALIAKKKREQQKKKEKELEEDSDYVFYKELEAKLKRDGKI